MKSLALPNNDAIQRLDQAFQLFFQSSPKEYGQLCKAFCPLGGLPRAWIIKGESGVGKTYLTKVLCKKYDIPCTVTITIGGLATMYPGDLLKGLKMYLGSIKHHSKAVVILDNIELIFPREESDFALVYAFQSWINDLVEQELSTSSSTFSSNHISSPSIKGSAAPRVIVLGLTQDARGLDPSVASLFDDSIELDIPTPEERCLILTACARNHGISLQPQEQKYEHEQQQQQTEGDGSTFAIDHVKSSEILDTKEWLQVSLEPIAAKCHGYLAADLDALCRQAAIIAYQRHERTMDQLTVQDFIEAMKTIKVSALRQSTSVQKVDPVYWSDIGGLEEVKKTLEESVIWLYKHSEAFKRMGISPSKGVLLYGPPGTGKTMLAKAVATESEANFMAVVVPDLIKGEVGESEKAIAKVFKMATRCSPCIIFLDELEAIFGARESSGGLGKQIISQLLLEMDNCGEGVVVLAATNHPEVIDSSILRPGRLDRLVYVPPPTFEERVAILQILKQSTRISSSVDLRTVGNLTNCFTGADIKALVRRSGLLALRANRTSIEPQDFFTASSEIRPSVNQFDLLRYENFHQ